MNEIQYEEIKMKMNVDSGWVLHVIDFVRLAWICARHVQK